ncbi:Berberine bridge enzyme-like 8 [Bienertia sinuspersici]
MLRILILIFCISYAKAASNNSIETFLNCLPLHSNTSISISKTIYTPQNASFSSILDAYVRNLRFNTSSTLKPLAIITPLEKSHVQATIICAKDHGLEMRIRSGGHDYEGLSYVSPNPFIILDLFHLRSIDIDLRTDSAWVQSGATLGELYYNIANISNTRAFPAGVCPSVGVGGHFSGGGYGNMLRKFGLAIDNIIDAEIVDANGMILDRRAMGDDLFWAIRGGGASSFCVVLAWKIRLVQVPEKVTTFRVSKTLEERGGDIFNQYQHVAPNLDPNLFIRAEVHVPPPLDQKGLKNVDCNEQSWVESIIFYDDLPMNTSTKVLLDRVPSLGVTHSKRKSDYVKEPIPMVSLDSLWKKMIEVENITLKFNPYGGKMSEISETATPFPHRKGILFKIQYLSDWKENSSVITHRNLREIREIHNFMTPYVSKNPREAFLNYRDIDIGTNANDSFAFTLDYFKGNFKRLLKVKAKFDPSNFFRHEQSIPILAIK